MNKLYSLGFLTIIIFFSIFVSELFSEQKKVLNLSECLKIAEENNFDIQLTMPSIEASDANVINAMGSYLPSISMNSSYSKRSFGTDSPLYFDGIYSVGANASINIFDSFGREARYNQAQNNYESTVSMANQTKSDVALEVYSRYIEVIKNYKIVDVRKANIESGERDLERIIAMNEAGSVSIGEVYGSEADLGNRRLELVNAENVLEISKSFLLSVMGLEPGDPFEFDKNSLPISLTKESIQGYRSQRGSLDKLYKKAINKRSDYRASDFDIQSRKSGITGAKSQYFPRLSASSGWGGTSTEFSSVTDATSFNFGVNLSVPIFTNFSVNNAIESAILAEEQSRINQLKLSNQIKTTLQNALLNLKAAEQTFLISSTTLRSAKLNDDSAKERFRVGAANITELSQTNAQLISAQISQINAAHNYYKAQKEIEHGIGEF
jgi:outer membrane protein